MNVNMSVVLALDAAWTLCMETDVASCFGNLAIIERWSSAIFMLMFSSSSMTVRLGYWYVSTAAAAAKSKAFEKFACEVAVLASRDGIKRSNKATF